ncbi:MAG TPA: hypothetical protein VFB81_15025 [Myxococcales bacterium]|nr:hypothetical protein [Myxococcales bacterium]
MSSTPQHPGTIVYVNGDTGEESASPISEVPEELRFAPDQDGNLVPVVRVVARTAGDQRNIHELGPDGQLLRSTVQIRS